MEAERSGRPLSYVLLEYLALGMATADRLPAKQAGELLAFARQEDSTTA